MCQMCEEYEAELRRLDPSSVRSITVKFEPDERAALEAHAKRNNRSAERDVLHILLTELGHAKQSPSSEP